VLVVRNSICYAVMGVKCCTLPNAAVVYPEILFGGGSTNSVEDRENGDLGAVAP